MARKLKPDLILFVTTLALVGVGVAMVFSSSAVLAMDWYGDPNHFAFRHVVAVLLGLVGMFALMRMDYHRLRHPAVVFSLLSVVTVLLVFAYLLPLSANTHRWIRLAGLSFQPAELATLGIHAAVTAPFAPFVGSVARRVCDRLDEGDARREMRLDTRRAVLR